MSVRVLLVDDQELIRESLHIVLDMDPEIEVVGMAENGKQAIDLCVEYEPNLVLMDIHMPEMDGVEATKEIKQRWPNIRVVILTTFQEVSFVVDALSAGAEGYLLKAIHPKDLVSGIKWVGNGGTLIPQDIARLLVTELRSDKAAADAAGGSGAAAKSDKLSAGIGKPDPYGLSERELQVLNCIAEGLNNREIAERLFLSEGTVKNYISSIYSKMDVRDRIHASKKAHDEGLV